MALLPYSVIFFFYSFSFRFGSKYRTLSEANPRAPWSLLDVCSVAAKAATCEGNKASALGAIEANFRNETCSGTLTSSLIMCTFLDEFVVVSYCPLHSVISFYLHEPVNNVFH